MTQFLSKCKKVLAFVGALFPTHVPIGMSDFQAWSDSIIELSGMPNNDSVRFAIATMVLHLGPTAAYKPKLYFVLALRAGASKQIASAVFQEIKQRQKEAEAAATASQSQSGQA